MFLLPYLFFRLGNVAEGSLVASKYTEVNTFGTATIKVDQTLVETVYNNSNSFGSATLVVGSPANLNLSASTYLSFNDFYHPTFTLGLHPSGIGSPGRNLVQRRREGLSQVSIQTLPTNGNIVFRYY